MIGVGLSEITPLSSISSEKIQSGCQNPCDKTVVGLQDFETYPDGGKTIDEGTISIAHAVHTVAPWQQPIPQKKGSEEIKMTDNEDVST